MAQNDRRVERERVHVLRSGSVDLRVAPLVGYRAGKDDKRAAYETTAAELSALRLSLRRSLCRTGDEMIRLVQARKTGG